MATVVAEKAVADVTGNVNDKTVHDRATATAAAATAAATAAAAAVAAAHGRQRESRRAAQRARVPTLIKPAKKQPNTVTPLSGPALSEKLRIWLQAWAGAALKTGTVADVIVAIRHGALCLPEPLQEAYGILRNAVRQDAWRYSSDLEIVEGKLQLPAFGTCRTCPTCADIAGRQHSRLKHAAATRVPKPEEVDEALVVARRAVSRGQQPSAPSRKNNALNRKQFKRMERRIKREEQGAPGNRELAVDEAEATCVSPAGGAFVGSEGGNVQATWSPASSTSFREISARAGRRQLRRLPSPAQPTAQRQVAPMEEKPPTVMAQRDQFDESTHQQQQHHRNQGSRQEQDVEVPQTSLDTTVRSPGSTGAPLQDVEREHEEGIPQAPIGATVCSLCQMSVPGADKDMAGERGAGKPAVPGAASAFSAAAAAADGNDSLAPTVSPEPPSWSCAPSCSLRNASNSLHTATPVDRYGGGKRVSGLRDKVLHFGGPQRRQSGEEVRLQSSPPPLPPSRPTKEEKHPLLHQQNGLKGVRNGEVPQCSTGVAVLSSSQESISGTDDGAAGTPTMLAEACVFSVPPVATDGDDTPKPAVPSELPSSSRVPLGPARNVGKRLLAPGGSGGGLSDLPSVAMQFVERPRSELPRAERVPTMKTVPVQQQPRQPSAMKGQKGQHERRESEGEYKAIVEELRNQVRQLLKENAKVLLMLCSRSFVASRNTTSSWPSMATV